MFHKARTGREFLRPSALLRGRLELLALRAIEMLRARVAE